MTAPLDPRREKYAGAITHHLPWGSPEQVDEATTAVMRVADRERQEMAAERFTWQERGDKAETRLRRAHQARRAKEHQLDDIRRALCDAGFMQDDDPYGHADLEDVIRQAGRLDELHAAVRADLEAEAVAETETCRPVEVDGETIRIRGAGQFTEQEQQFAEEIVRAAKRRYAAEHAEPDAKQLRAHAFNAVLFALNARGEWLPLSSRRAVADAVLDVVLPGARITATLARMSDAAVQRVIDLYERWVKAGPPPLGTSVSRWWDARLVELHDAVLPPEDQPEGQS